MWKSNQHDKGFSLLEILIALTLASLLLICIFHVYLSVKSLSSATVISATTQNHLRFLTYFLQHKITMAGYAGCGKLSNLDVKNNTDFPFAFAESIRGFTSSNLPAQLQKYHIAPNTDVIVVQKADEGASPVTDDVIHMGATKFHAQENPATKYNKNLLLADCRSADLFIADNIGGKLVRAKSTIAHEYQKGATQISRFTTIAYFISSSASGQPQQFSSYQVAPDYGLYYAVNYGNKEKLLSGIKNMQIRYGIESSGQGAVDNYFTAAQVTADNLWRRVKSVVLTITPASISSNSKVQSWDIYIKLRQRN